MKHFLLPLLALYALSSGSELNGQEREWNPALVGATREYLEELRSHFENAARSQAYSEELKVKAREQAARVRTRLEEGDFRVGDRIVMDIDRPVPRTDTLMVDTSRAVSLPTVGRVSLRGVLRSEIEGYLTDQVSRFVNEPVLRAKTYIRVSILGEVVQPGFHMLPPETPLADAIMIVGGPTVTADIDKVRIERGQQRFLDGPGLREALHEGQTLDELKLRAGDVVVIPAKPQVTVAEIFRSAILLSGTLIAIDRIFTRR
jgi:protein involved in polysaccharide export with SLBB domain